MSSTRWSSVHAIALCHQLSHRLTPFLNTLPAGFLLLHHTCPTHVLPCIMRPEPRDQVKSINRPTVSCPRLPGRQRLSPRMTICFLKSSRLLPTNPRVVVTRRHHRTITPILEFHKPHTLTRYQRTRQKRVSYPILFLYPDLK